MQLAFRLITTLVLFAFFTACQRPYALLQRTPGPQFRTDVDTGVARQTSAVDTLPGTNVADIQSVDGEFLEASASIALAVQSFAPGLIGRPTNQGQNNVLTPEITDQQPRPKARSNSNPPRKTFREWLGLRPRPQLNWWQRISWKLKASFFVILIAVVFAILNINTLAIIFGIIGAVLLVSGLRKTFKVRRPWF